MFDRAYEIAKRAQAITVAGLDVAVATAGTLIDTTKSVAGYVYPSSTPALPPNTPVTSITSTEPSSKPDDHTVQANSATSDDITADFIQIDHSPSPEIYDNEALNNVIKEINETLGLIHKKSLKKIAETNKEIFLRFWGKLTTNKIDANKLADINQNISDDEFKHLSNEEQILIGSIHILFVNFTAAKNLIRELAKYRPQVIIAQHPIINFPFAENYAILASASKSLNEGIDKEVAIINAYDNEFQLTKPINIETLFLHTKQLLDQQLKELNDAIRNVEKAQIQLTKLLASSASSQQLETAKEQLNQAVAVFINHRFMQQNDYQHYSTLVLAHNYRVKKILPANVHRFNDQCVNLNKALVESQPFVAIFELHKMTNETKENYLSDLAKTADADKKTRATLLNLRNHLKDYPVITPNHHRDFNAVPKIQNLIAAFKPMHEPPQLGDIASLCVIEPQPYKTIENAQAKLSKTTHYLLAQTDKRLAKLTTLSKTIENYATRLEALNVRLQELRQELSTTILFSYPLSNSLFREKYLAVEEKINRIEDTIHSLPKASTTKEYEKKLQNASKRLHRTNKGLAELHALSARINNHQPTFFERHPIVKKILIGTAMGLSIGICFTGIGAAIYIGAALSIATGAAIGMAIGITAGASIVGGVGNGIIGEIESRETATALSDKMVKTQPPAAVKDSTTSLFSRFRAAIGMPPPVHLDADQPDITQTSDDDAVVIIPRQPRTTGTADIPASPHRKWGI